jgi:hypothetical protein
MNAINAGAGNRRTPKAEPTTPVNSIVATAATACDLDTAYKDAETEQKVSTAKKNRIKRDHNNGRM